MKTHFTYFTLFFFCSLSSIAQTDKIKSLFYNLPVESSGKNIYTSLRTDKRFTETTKSKVSKRENTFIGFCSDKGLIKAKPDSVMIELGYGKAKIPDSDSLVKTVVLRSKYFFTLLDSARNEYSRISAYLRPMARDSSESAFAEDDGSSGEGMFYNFSPDKNKIDDIEISIVYFVSGNFGLFITYTKRDE